MCIRDRVYTEKPEKKTVQLVIDKLEVNETQTIEYELRVKNLADKDVYKRQIKY